MLKKRIAEENSSEDTDQSSELLIKALEQLQTENSSLKKELVKLSVDLNAAKRYATIQDDAQGKFHASFTHLSGVDILTRTIQNLTNQIKEKEETITSLQSKEKGTFKEYFLLMPLEMDRSFEETIGEVPANYYKKLERWQAVHQSDKATIKQLKESNQLMSKRTTELQSVVVGLTKKLEGNVTTYSQLRAKTKLHLLPQWLPRKPSQVLKISY
jgi:predicted RNase H-like nuclease (RuvC/YqgF family)